MCDPLQCGGSIRGTLTSYIDPKIFTISALKYSAVLLQVFFFTLLVLKNLPTIKKKEIKFKINRNIFLF